MIAPLTWQDLLDSKFEKRRQGQDKDTGLPFTLWGPVLGKTFAIFIDDLNMPKRERYGAQPPVELIRQLADHGGWYDRKTLRMRRVVDVQARGPHLLLAAHLLLRRTHRNVPPATDLCRRRAAPRGDGAARRRSPADVRPRAPPLPHALVHRDVQRDGVVVVAAVAAACAHAAPWSVTLPT